MLYIFEVEISGFLFGDSVVSGDVFLEDNLWEDVLLKQTYKIMFCWEQTCNVFLASAWWKAMWYFAGADSWEGMGSPCNSLLVLVRLLVFGDDTVAMVLLALLHDLCLSWLHRKPPKNFLVVFQQLLAASTDSCWLAEPHCFFWVEPVLLFVFGVLLGDWTVVSGDKNCPKELFLNGPQALFPINLFSFFFLPLVGGGIEGGWCVKEP